MPAPLPTEAGLPIKKFIREQRWNYHECAEAAGVSYRTIVTYVHGRAKKPKPHIQEALAELVGKTVEECFPSENESEK